MREVRALVADGDTETGRELTRALADWFPGHTDYMDSALATWVTKKVAGGAPVVSDGPFAETKEFLAGYWIVDVEKPQRAYEIAAMASSAPGPDGQPLVIPIELREVMGAPLPSEG